MQWKKFNGDLERDREGKSDNETDKKVQRRGTNTFSLL